MLVLDAVLLEGLLLVTQFFTPVGIRNHGDRKVVNPLEQLTELSKARVMPGIDPKSRLVE